jgi:hypothetical protein
MRLHVIIESPLPPFVLGHGGVMYGIHTFFKSSSPLEQWLI